MLAGATRLCVRLRGAATTTEDLMRVHIGKVSRRWGGVKGNHGWRGGLKGSGNCKSEIQNDVQKQDGKRGKGSCKLVIRKLYGC